MPDPSSIALTLLTAPAWARVGLTAPSERLREAAAHEIAMAVLGSLEGAQGIQDAGQITLPF